jgi:hypothetical protein
MNSQIEAEVRNIFSRAGMTGSRTWIWKMNGGE